MRWTCFAVSILLAFGSILANQPAQRTLTFEDRVKAQEAIERVYYSHQIGATRPFEQAVPRAVLEAKVRKYLDETAALKVYWKTALTDEMLQRELERMAIGTRMPERLLELYAALGNDSFLIKECLARATLVDRLARDAYAFDPTLHADTRRRAEELHRQLASGELSPAANHPDRSMVELVMSNTAEVKSKNTESLGVHRTRPLRHDLSPDEFRKLRAELPSAVGALSALKEERDAFVFSLVLGEESRDVRAANYVVPKNSWDDWWTPSVPPLRNQLVVAVASRGGVLPKPTWGLAVGADAGREQLNSGTCPIEDGWTTTGTANAPVARYAHTAVWTGSVMVVWGGTDGAGYFNTGGRYDPATDSWTPTSTAGAPSARISHTAVWAGNLMIVWGGNAFGPSLNTGGRYDPATDTWTPTAMTGAPSARYQHTAVWTGSLMVILLRPQLDWTLFWEG